MLVAVNKMNIVTFGHLLSSTEENSDCDQLGFSGFADAHVFKLEQRSHSQEENQEQLGGIHILDWKINEING